MEEVVILGGGVAGLSCLNAFLDFNKSPLLLEGSMIGTPKMCGEFLSPNIVSCLKRWDVGPLISIKDIHFVSKKSSCHIDLPRAAGAFARSRAEAGLARSARMRGGRIREHARVLKITPASDDKPYTFFLESGEVIQSQHAIFATGRFSVQQQSLSNSLYLGFKTHIPRVIQPEALVMLSLDQGYLGIVPVDSKISNMTCLIQKRALHQRGGREALLRDVFKQKEFSLLDLESLEWNKLDWLEGDAPNFGLKRIPSWPRAFWIGDAFASILPSIGYGFGHSVYSAMSAVEHYIASNSSYHQNMKKHLQWKWTVSKALHHVLQKPNLCSVLSPLLKMNPWMGQSMLRILNY